MLDTVPSWVEHLGSLADAASPGPWSPVATDDNYATSAEGIAFGEFPRSIPRAFPAGCARSKFWRGWPHPSQVVAVTLLQNPSLAGGNRFDENAAFIQSAREYVPRLCDQIAALVDISGRIAGAADLTSGEATSQGGARVRGRWTSEARSLADAADPAPWTIHGADDVVQMRAVYVAHGNEPYPENELVRWGPLRWPASEHVVAVTCLQSPGLALARDHEANASFIAAAREGVPKLCDLVDQLAERLQSLVVAAEGLADPKLIAEARAWLDREPDG